MRKITDFIRDNSKPLFFSLLVVNALWLSVMNKHHELLISPHSPGGIISLQLNCKSWKQDSIIATWSRSSLTRQVFSEDSVRSVTVTGLQTAERQTRLDFFFIFLYVCLLCVPVVRFFPDSRVGYGVALVLLAGLLDAVENMFLLQAFSDPRISPLYIFIPACAKLAMLAVLLATLLFLLYRKGYGRRMLVGISTYLQLSVAILWRFRIVIISLLILFAALWISDQGRDLLLIINSKKLGPVLFLITTTVLAFLNWHFPKYYDRAHALNISLRSFFSWDLSYENNRVRKQKSETARQLGILTFLIPAVSILHAMQVFQIAYLLNDIHPLLLLFSVLTFYQLILHYQWIERLYVPNNQFSWSRFLWTIGMILVFVCLPVFLPQSKNPNFLAFLALNLFLLSFAFLLFTTLRTCIPQQRVLRKLNISPIVVLSGIAFCLVFLYCSIFPETVAFSQAARYLTLPVVFVGVIFYTTLLTALLLVGRKYKVQLISMALLAGLIMAAVKDNKAHEVTLQSTRFKPPMEDLHHYTRSWLLSRKEEIIAFNSNSGKDPYPVFIVNAYGGGIRAAAWTSVVINELEKQLLETDMTYSRTDSNYYKGFQHYVFAYSGASGGTIGASVLCAARFSALEQQKRDSFYRKWFDLYQNDFLTPVLIGLMGRDVLTSGIGFPLFKDRAFLQDQVWEQHLGALHIPYDSLFRYYWYSPSVRRYEVPLLFANSYDVDLGLKAVAAPVQLQPGDFPGSIFIEDLVTDSTRGLKLSTAAFLSARFPFISPSGKIGTHHFLDGGLKENSGAETAREILSVFNSEWQKLQQTDSTFRPLKIKIHVLSLPNTAEGGANPQKADNLFELTAPLTALMNNWIGNTRKADSVNARDTTYKYIPLRPKALPAEEKFVVALPLGWQISDYALRQMQASVRAQDTFIKDIIQKVRPLKKREQNKPGAY